MIALYIILGILALILFVLLVNVHLIFLYDGEAKVYLRVLFLRFDAKELAKSLGGEKKEKKTKKKAPEKKEEAPTRKRKKESISDFLSFLSLITRIVTRAVKDLFARMHVHLKDMEIRFGLSDADQTAMVYGASIQAANALFALLQRFSNFKWNNDKLILAPDFTGENQVFRIHLDLYIKPIFLLSIALRALTTYLEGKEQ